MSYKVKDYVLYVTKYEEIIDHIILKNLNENTSITTLDLSNNIIGDKGIKFLAQVLKENNSLNTLNLKSGKIGEKETELLAH